MAITNVPITAGAGTAIAVDSTSAGNDQLVKLDVGALGTNAVVTAGGTNYLPVTVSSLAGGLNLPVSPASGSQFPVINASGTTIAISAAAAIPVSAIVTAPVFVQLSNGATAITTLPVSGTISANQGTPAAVANAWPILLTDGTHMAALTSVSAAYALNVAVVQTVGSPAVGVDNSAFTVGTGSLQVIGALYNDAATSPTSGQVAAVRMTAFRGLHVNLRTNAGVEIGTSASPLYTQPAAAGLQASNITQFGGNSLVAAAAGIPKVGLSDNSGNAFGDSNPLLVQQAAKFRTRVTTNSAVIASQTAAILWTPTTGKAFYITSLILTVSVSGTFTLFDNTNAAGNVLMDGTQPVGVVVVNLDPPWASAAVNNILKYTSGTGLTGVLAVHGFQE